MTAAGGVFETIAEELCVAESVGWHFRVEGFNDIEGFWNLEHTAAEDPERP